MKIEEAIQYWQGSKLEAEEYFRRGKIDKKFKEQLVYYDMAIAALEKQIPKEVISNNGLNETRCSKCDGVFGYSLELDEYTGEKFDYCYGCGQALKWD